MCPGDTGVRHRLMIAVLAGLFGSLLLEGVGEACCHRRKNCCPQPTVCVVPVPAPCPMPVSSCGHRKCRKHGHGHCVKARPTCAPAPVVYTSTVPFAPAGYAP